MAKERTPEQDMEMEVLFNELTDSKLGYSTITLSACCLFLQCFSVLSDFALKSVPQHTGTSTLCDVTKGGVLQPGVGSVL